MIDIINARTRAKIERAAGPRERAILDNLDRVEIETERGGVVVSLYSTPDETGHRDGCTWDERTGTWCA